MLNKKEFDNIKGDLEKFEKERESQISKSREVIRLSKVIINALHRDDSKTATAGVKEIKSKVKSLSTENYDLSFTNVAFQEYVEALCYYDFVTKKKMPTRKELCVDTQNYLLGICDLTGELVRKAVNSAIKRKFDEVIAIKDYVAEIYSAFLQFNLRNSELRRKTDSIKYNLMKLENLVYEIRKK